MQILYGQLTEDSGTDTVTGPEPEAVKATDPVPLSILHGPEVPLAAPLMIVAVVAGQSHTLLPKTTNGVLRFSWAALGHADVPFL